MSFAFLVRAYYIARAISALINWNRTPPTNSPNFPHDDTYTGETNSKGEPHGQGTMTWADSVKLDAYTGAFKDDKFNGEGTMTYANGSTYTGEWKDGQPNGQGTMTYPDGGKDTGEWKDGEYNGQGTMTFTDGTTYTGKWEDGEQVP